jgi:hypothetical protein
LRKVTQAAGLELADKPTRSSSSGADEALTFRVRAAGSDAEKPRGDRRYGEIYGLADAGCDAAEISRRLGTPVGEVELILGLRGAQ